MKKCPYRRHELLVPTSGCCWAYYEAKRPDGLKWVHFPTCSKENCPIKHPDLLEGAKLSEPEE